MKTKLLIVADDFTGGLDTGVQLAKQGISVRIVVEPEMGTPWAQTDAQVLVAVNETRHLPPDQAYDIVYRVVSDARQAGIPYVYKKTDSALRGNIGAELSAALDASGADVLSFLPAYPTMHRITVNGCQYIDGVPVAESVFGQDPFDPVRESDVSKWIWTQTETPVIRKIGSGRGILVVDAESDEDLQEAGRCLASAGALRVSAGCAGFAAFLPELLELAQDKTQALPDLGKSLLVVSGSLNPITIRQLDHAEKAGFERIRLRPDQAGALPFTQGWMILDSTAMQDYIQQQRWDPGEARSRVADFLAETLAKTEGTYQGTVMIIGGDTLLACLKRQGCKEIEPIAELFPGVVLSKYKTDTQEKLIISKSGGFGAETLLADLRARMQQKEQPLEGGNEDMKQNDLPILAITMGDPASIGPGITAKALADASMYQICRPLVVGDVGMMEKALRITGLENLKIHKVSTPEEADFAYGVIDVLDMGLVDADTLPVGQVSAEAGEAAFRYVEKTIALAMTHEVDGTVTNALNKEAINLAGHHFAGHTEIYAHYTNTEKYTMMLAHGDLRVVHVSTHVSLREACDRVKKDRVLEVIRIAWQACRDLGIDEPRIGVAGLNPHSGENGLFGREEIDEIIPAIQEAQAAGIQVDGPVPPDTVFSKARGGWYDIVVAMYHDQGHIPLKLVGFVYDRAAGAWQSVEGVNITLGLPIIRVSVDHGTAFDQAGLGTADPSSLQNAISYAARLAVSSR